jgi:hypothetical protein
VKVGDLQVRRLTIPLVLVVCMPVAAALAFAAGGSAPLAAAGAALVLLHWGLEQVFTAAGYRGSASRAVAAGVGGLMVRFVVVGGLLVLIGVLHRQGYIACVLAFVGVFTLGLSLRVLLGLPVSAGRSAP